MAQRFPRPGPDSLELFGLIPGGMRIPNPAGGRLPGVLIRLTTSTLAFATPMAGTTQVPQLHCIPAHANFPILNPHAELGHVRRPDNGASEPYSDSDVSVEPGKRDGRIHVSGCRKTCAQSVPGACAAFP